MCWAARSTSSGPGSAPTASSPPPPRSAFAPQAAAGALGVELLAQRRPRVRVVGLDDEQPGVAEAEQLIVEPLAVDDDVREQTPVPVPLLDVELELHRPPEELRARVRGRLGPEALDGLDRM